jgi:hypothetical protein
VQDMVSAVRQIKKMDATKVRVESRDIERGLWPRFLVGS